MSNEEFKKLAYDLGNIGAEVSRLLNWQKQGEQEQARSCLMRALDLLDSLIEHKMREPFLRELLCLREVLCAKVFSPDEYEASETQLKNYFLPFAALAREE